MKKLYAIKYDLGYGDWGITERNLTEEEVLKWFKELRGVEFASFKEALDAEPILGYYTIVDNNEPDNQNWESS